MRAVFCLFAATALVFTGCDVKVEDKPDVNVTPKPDVKVVTPQPDVKVKVD